MFIILAKLIILFLLRQHHITTWDTESIYLLMRVKGWTCTYLKWYKNRCINRVKSIFCWFLSLVFIDYNDSLCALRSEWDKWLYTCPCISRRVTLLKMLKRKENKKANKQKKKNKTKQKQTKQKQSKNNNKQTKKIKKNINTNARLLPDWQYVD